MYLYSALFVVPYLTLKALRHASHSVTCNYTNACLYLVSVRQMALPRLRLRTSNYSRLLSLLTSGLAATFVTLVTLILSD